MQIECTYLVRKINELGIGTITRLVGFIIMQVITNIEFKKHLKIKAPVLIASEMSRENTLDWLEDDDDPAGSCYLPLL